MARSLFSIGGLYFTTNSTNVIKGNYAFCSHCGGSGQSTCPVYGGSGKR